MIHKFSRLLMTLVALFAMTTGAWAQTAFIMKEVTADMVPTTWNGDETTITVDDLPGFISVDMDAAKAWTGAPSDAYVTILYSVDGTWFSELNYNKGGEAEEGGASYERRHFYNRIYNPGYKIYYTAVDPDAIEVTWDATTKQATFLMPVGDVELQVEYYPGMLTLGGDAIEGGTVEVVGMTDDALPAGFEKDAEGNIYVAQGTTFTLKAVPEEGYHFVCWSDDETNTNPEREISMPTDGSDLSLTATFAENEYDITFSEGTNPDPENPEWTAAPNPAKTKETVTVTYSGTKKVIGVKAEKKAPTLKDALADGATVVINYTWSGTYVTTFTFTNNAGTFTGNVTGIEAEYFSKNMLQDGTTLKFTASNADYSDLYVDIRFYTDTNEYYFADKGSRFNSFTISVNGTDLTDQLSQLK